MKQKEHNLKREIKIELKELDEEKRQVELSFSSEKPYSMWFGDEILSHDDGALDLSRLNEIGCVLFNHKRDFVVAKIEKAWVENKRGKAIITFDDDDDSEKIYAKVKSGTLKAVSVGYWVDSWEEVASGKVSSTGHVGPCSVALRWTPYEISIVSVPADDSVGVGRSYENEGSMNLSFFERQYLLNKNKMGVLENESTRIISTTK